MNKSLRYTFLVFMSLWCGFSRIEAKPPFSLEDIFVEKKFRANSLPNLQFINAENYLIQKDDFNSSSSVVTQYEWKTNHSSVVFDSETLKEKFNLPSAIITSFEYLGKDKYLVGLSKENIYRHSSQSQYYYVDKNLNVWISLAEGKKISCPTIAPNGERVAYILNNNIYIFYFSSLKTEQVTQDGLSNQIINGKGDWAYQEEFGVENTMTWSPDSKYLAYMKFDESEVKEFSFQLFSGNYPRLYSYKYPKSGEELSKVTVMVYRNKKHHECVQLDAFYIPEIRWKDHRTLTLLTLNRLQNNLKVYNYSVETSLIDSWYEEEDSRYIALPNLFTILPDGELAISSERSGYNHLYFVDNSKNIHPVTHGNFDIEDVVRIDLDDSLVVFTSHLPQPERKSILSWNMKDSSLLYLSDTTGTNSINMLGGGYYIEKFTNQHYRSKISIKSLNNPVAQILLDDKREEDSVLIKKDFFWMPINNYVLRAWKMLPPDFDSTKKYPVLFYAYGGPESHLVEDEWGNSLQIWLNYMAQSGFIVVCIDSRGTAFRGAEFKKMTYAKLGQLEVEDQLEAIRYMNRMNYVDSDNVFMFGWSYGGYMTLMCMMQDEKLLKGGISVAPVTDWRYYNAIYTERYMRTPVGNLSGYEKASAIVRSEKLQGRLLLIHGTADDNVHFQNSLELSKSLVNNNKIFEMIPYVNANHNIGGSSTQLQLYRSMTDFLENCLHEESTNPSLQK